MSIIGSFLVTDAVRHRIAAVAIIPV